MPSKEIAARPQRRAEVRPPPKLGGKRERPTCKTILEAAFGLIGNEKDLFVRIEEICAAADVSRRMSYNYFTSLEQLFGKRRNGANKSGGTRNPNESLLRQVQGVLVHD